MNRPTPSPYLQAFIDLSDIEGNLVRTKISGNSYYQYFEFGKGITLRVRHTPGNGFRYDVNYELSGPQIPQGRLAGWVYHCPGSWNPYCTCPEFPGGIKVNPLYPSGI